MKFPITVAFWGATRGAKWSMWVYFGNFIKRRRRKIRSTRNTRTWPSWPLDLRSPVAATGWLCRNHWEIQKLQENIRKNYGKKHKNIQKPIFSFIFIYFLFSFLWLPRVTTMLESLRHLTDTLDNAFCNQPLARHIHTKNMKNMIEYSEVFNVWDF